MQRQLLALGNLFPTLLVSLLVLSTPFLWAQIMQSTEGSLFNDPLQVGPVPEASTHLGLVFGGLPLSFEAARRQTEPQVKFFNTPINFQAAPNLQRATEMAELPGNAKYSTGSAPSQWLKSTDATVHYPTIQPPIYFRYFGHHFPWAGPIILRVSQEARSHPHVTGVLKLFRPRF